jgi:hypothetical protein
MIKNAFFSKFQDLITSEIFLVLQLDQERIFQVPET